MLVPLTAFAAVFGVFFGASFLFLYSGRNQQIRVGAARRGLLFGGLTAPLAGALPCGASKRQQLERYLHHAGHYHRDALTEFLALRHALVLGWIAIIVTFLAVGTEPGDGFLKPAMIVGAVGLVICYTFPRLMLETLAKSRVQRIEHDLPDALDMITMCMTGGLPLSVAMARVSDEMQHSHPDLACELRIVGRQTEAGSMDSALRRFAQRIDAPEVQSLAAIIGQTETQGAGVAMAFQDFADNVRLARRQRADEQGNKTALKLLFPLIFCLAPPVYIMLLAPAAIELRNFVKEEAGPGGLLATSPTDLNDVIQNAEAIEYGDTIRQLPPPQPLEQVDNRPVAGN
jgi:tight adherence protein C